MSRYLFTLLFCAGLTSYGQLKIDHIIYAVKDLDSAKKVFTEKGFTIKNGTKHSNGIENAHIKFSNGSSFELTSLYKYPTDKIAQQYNQFLKNSEGIMFISLSGIALDKIALKLDEQNITYTISKHKLWSYLTFPNDSPLHPFFFIEYHHILKEDPNLYQHRNGYKSIDLIQIQHQNEIEELLQLIEIPKLNKSYHTSTGKIKLIHNSSENLHVPSIRFK